jgi:DNA polymerase-3 subunit alpha
MAFIQLEDLHGTIEVVVFPNVYERYRDIVKEDSVVVIRGTINCREEEAPKVLAEWVQCMDDRNGAAFCGLTEIVKLRIPEDADSEATIADIKQLLAKHPGDVPVRIYLGNSGRSIRADTTLWVSNTPQFKEEMERLIGKENVK